MHLNLVAADLASSIDGWDAEEALIQHARDTGVTDTMSLLDLVDAVADTLEQVADDENLAARDLMDVLEAWEDNPDAALTDLQMAA